MILDGIIIYTPSPCEFSELFINSSKVLFRTSSTNLGSVIVKKAFLFEDLSPIRV